MTALDQDAGLRPDPDAYPVRLGAANYWMYLPQAGTDYIQKKIADTSEPYEREMLEEMAARLLPGDLVVDVGANVGNHTLFLAAVAGCRIVSLEPNQALASSIRISAALNGLAEQVEVLAIGAGASGGVASLKADNPANLGAQKLLVGAGEIEVRPLDELDLGPVKAIKIDVEGMELEVLQGAERLIARERPLLYVESINDVAFRKLQRWLEPRRYICWETFNATPTHLFMPLERVSVDERSIRLQGKTFHETYRTGLLLSSVRTRLAQATEQERRARDALAQAQAAATAAAERLTAAESDRESWKQLHAEQALMSREQLAHMTQLQSHAAELTRAVRESEACAVQLRLQLQGCESRIEEQARRMLKLEATATEQVQQLKAAEARIVEQARELHACEIRMMAQTKDLQACEARLAEQLTALQVSEGRIVDQSRTLQASEVRLAEQAHQLRLHEHRAEDQARQVAELELLGRQAEAEIEGQRARLQELEGRATSQQKRLVQVEAERSALKASLSRTTQELQKFRERAGRLSDEQRRLRTLALDGQRDLNQLRQEHERVIGSVRFRLGSALADARSPSGLIKLPVRLWRAWRSKPEQAALAPPAAPAPGPAVQEIPAVRSAPEVDAQTRSEPVPEPQAKRGFPHVAAPAAPAPTLPSRNAPQPGYRAVAPLGAAALRIAALSSADAEALFGADCHWHRLTPEADLPPLEGIDVLLIEGRQLPIAMDQAPSLLRWRERLCQAANAGVATVLWVEGDPQHQPALLEVAGLVHAVLCDDADSVVLMRRWLGHGKVALWPSAFQPRALSPFSPVSGELPRLADLIVVDAQSQSRLPVGLWAALVRRQLPVAAYSRACRLLFGDLTVSTDDPTERERAIRRWLEDPQGDAGRVAESLLKAWRDHRSERRLQSLMQLLWPGSAQVSAHHVAVVAEIQSHGDIEVAARLVAEQAVPASLWCLGSAGAEDLPAAPETIAGIPVHWVSGGGSFAALFESGATHVAVLDRMRPWPAGRLAHLLAATLWSGAEGAAVAGNGVEASEWTCGPGKAPWPVALLAMEHARRWLQLGNSQPLANSWVEARLAFVGAAALPTGTSTGVSLAALQAAITASGSPSEGRLDITPPLALAAKAWMALLPATPPAGVNWTQTPEGLEFEARIPDARVEYAYLERRFDVRDLKPGQSSLMQMTGKLTGDVRLVLVFYDAQSRKLSHVMHAVNTAGVMAVPEGAVTARLALRFQREAGGCLHDIELARPRLPARVAVPAAPFLLIAKQYPSYDDLYRFAFVHSRVRGYRERGTRVDVFRLGGEPRGGFREFEGVDVQDGDQQRLHAALAVGAYGTVLVHYMDRHVWTVLREHLHRMRVIVWVHGAEIQPWWRRAMNFHGDGERDAARRASDQRLAMWREVMSSDSPNLRLVFVSAKQAGEVFADLGMFLPPDRYRVISNFIDPAVFPYRAKSAHHRRRILSIRPYASNVYANDLMVRTIEILSLHPVFPLLQFTVIGDGPLFDTTVEPLRRFDNVSLQQRFLTQHEIADVHREHGIFLVPSRMDSQGVSRDEAMSSGLVPVTTRIAAIPEFVDDACAFLAEPEDAQGLADAILVLQEDEGRFLRMSEAAAARVRARSGIEQTVGRELALVREAEVEAASARVVEQPAIPVAVYGDLNLNIMDGSAIWAASLAETLSGLPGVGVTLLFKARIHRTQVVARLLDRTPHVRFVEPPFTDRNQGLDVAGALRELLLLDDARPFHAFVLRGFDLCTAAASESRMRGRLWAYLTDIPQSADDLTPESHARVGAIVEACRFLLCQTPQFESHILAHWPGARGKTVLLPPMIPPPAEAAAEPRAHDGFRLCYAGKFAPRWGIRDLFAAFGSLSARLPGAALHVYGDKIHHVPSEPGFRAEIRQLLETTPGVSWHGAVDRDALMRAVSGMDACWAFRDPAFEAATHELSTKVLEYASTGVPVVLARSPVNEALLGADYPLFADDAMHAADLLARLAQEVAFRDEVSLRLRKIADAHAFEAVGQRLVAQGVLL